MRDAESPELEVTPALVLRAYAAGVFPMADSAETEEIFWVDPREDLVVIFMTQLMPSATFNFRGQLKSIVYSAIVD